MSYLYQNVARAVALRAKQLRGGDYTARDSAYLAATIEPSLDGTEVTYGMLRHAILTTAKEIAAMCANSSNALFKLPLQSQRTGINDGDLIPKLDNNSIEFIGALDGFYDTVDNTSLTEQPLTQVIRRIENEGGFWKIPAYDFAFDGPVLRHTRTQVYARGYIWDSAAAETAFDTDPVTPGTITFSNADVNVGNDTITEAGHNLYTGFRLRVTKVGTTLPAGLTDGQVVYAIVVDANTIKPANTLSDSLRNIPINLTSVGSGSHTLTPIGAVGGGLCPLSTELEALHVCKTLAYLPEEDWFVPMASYYRDLVAQKESDIIEGRVRLMSLPQMPVNSASVNPAKD